jgi:hypothetical protein
LIKDGEEFNMNEKIFKARTKKLAVAIIKEVDKLPRSRATDVIGKQLLRSGQPLKLTTTPHAAQNHLQI